MEELNQLLSSDVGDLKGIEGKEKSLLDMEDFETLETSAATTDLMGNLEELESFGLTSTTRPLVTGGEEGFPSTGGASPFHQPTSDYANDDISSLIDIGGHSRVEGFFGDSAAGPPQRSSGGGDQVSIDEVRRGGSSGHSQISTAGVDVPILADLQQGEIEGLPKFKDPKIVPEPKSESENYYESGSSAYESSAQPSPLKRNIAMESETANNDAKSTENNCPLAPCAWFNPEKLHPMVADYVYWKDPKKSGVVFGASLILLLSLKFCSLVSVIAYFTLTLLSATVSFRIYKNVLQAVHKSNEGHPFKEYLDMDITLSQDKVNEIANTLVQHVNCTVSKLRSLVLVEDLFDTIKLAVLAWCLTYVGAWFNGLTLIILTLVAAFTLPKVYETNKAQIDTYAEILRTKGKEYLEMINAKMPMGKKKKEQ